MMRGHRAAVSSGALSDTKSESLETTPAGMASPYECIVYGVHATKYTAMIVLFFSTGARGRCELRPLWGGRIPFVNRVHRGAGWNQLRVLGKVRRYGGLGFACCFRANHGAPGRTKRCRDAAVLRFGARP